MFLRRILSNKLQSSIRAGIESYVRDVRNGNRIQALLESAEFAEVELHSVTSYSDKKKLMDRCIELANANNKSNSVFLEFGVFQGESINYMAERTSFHIFGFDSFEGLPENWRSGFGKGHFNVSNIPMVKNNVTLIKGWFCETLKEFDLESINPAFIHIDCDLYESTKDVLNAIGDHIKPGCVLLFDEFYNYPGWKSGEWKAWKEYCEKNKLSFEYLGFVPTSEQVAIVVV